LGVLGLCRSEWWSGWEVVEWMGSSEDLCGVV
nr:hypothetical protein [Tanacetum cinerariifolium]